MKILPLVSPHYLYLEKSYKEWLTIVGYADPTVKKWPAHVRELLHYLEQRSIQHITLVKAQDLQAFVRYIHERSNQSKPGALSSSSIRTIVNAVNSFSRYLNSTGRFVMDMVYPQIESDTEIKTILTVEEIKRLYEASFIFGRNNTVAMGQRDRAIIAIFYGCGLRRQEGIQLNLTDVDWNKKLVFVRKGKGNKQRYVPIASKHANDIEQYVTESREWFLCRHYSRDYTNKFAKRKEAPDDGAFFIGQHGGRMLCFYKRLRLLAERAGINQPFALHNLRHSIATHLLQSGMPIEEISKFLGHSSLDSTQIYTHIINEQNRNRDE